MLGLFKAKPLLSDEDIEFQVATFKWLLKNFGGKDFYEDAHLVLPTRTYFPSKVGTAQEAAVETFEVVRQYAGLEEWPCKLVAQDEDMDIRVAPTVAIQNAPNSPNGTFQMVDDSEIVITYNPSLVGNPTLLVATFAHELSHYLTGSCPEKPPGGWDNWEFATDITATFLGFGIFMANSALNFRQFTEVDSQGWQVSRSGYLTEAEHIFALAIFLRLKNMSMEAASPYLKRNLRSMLKSAMNYLADVEVIEELSSIDYAPRTVINS